MAAAILLPTLAHGSFGGSPCRDFGCYFSTWGLLLGTVGVPVSAVIFAVLHAVFCHEEKSKTREFLLGGVFGAVAYEVSVVCGALIGVSGKAPPGRETDYVLMGFLATYVILAIVSVNRARSSPAEEK